MFASVQFPLQQRLIKGCDWLFTLTDQGDPDDPNFQRAQRLYFDVELAVWERGLRSDDAAAASG